MEKCKEMKAVFIIVNAGFSDDAVELTRACGSYGATVLNAKGAGHTLKNFLGIGYDPEKEMILSIVEEEVAEKIVEEIKLKMGSKSSAGGICFFMPINHSTLASKNNNNINETN